ncbi:S8 family peptidase [Sorangium sp. So ce145]|uniref:S8 family peptidase n=1 Tax=Sorangium sp. So ce145 TaxID=3133285 RepID=UPI003F60B273
MYEYRYGGQQAKARKLEPASEYVAVRIPHTELESLEALEGTLEQLPEAKRVILFEGEGLLVVKPSDQAAGGALREKVLESLDDTTRVLAEDRVLKDTTGEPVVYTDKVYVRFAPDAAESEVDAILAGQPIAERAPAGLHGNSFILTVGPDVGAGVFRIANELLDDPRVEAAHPELLRESKRREATANQWHLRKITVGGVGIDQHCNAMEAWVMTRGKGITIALIDDGVDTDHPEFAVEGKVVHPFDATLQLDDARPKRRSDMHGTACAGVACAAGIDRASGVAPDANLMPIRLASGLGSMAELKAFRWAVDHHADVISCSWGPTDGEWWNAADPLHDEEYPIPDSFREAMEYALTKGRGGKGCVVVWAAGNGNESVDNDGYASHPQVVAVAACNDRGKRSVYSDYGAAVWCAFPSGDFEHPEVDHPAPLTPGIWTTDRRGAQGYNKGHLRAGDNALGDADGNYTATFGGTSSACPGIAGMAALMLSVNPRLRGADVRELIKLACVRIDAGGGAYDATGHSKFYGFGRPDAAVAVQLARDFNPGG